MTSNLIQRPKPKQATISKPEIVKDTPATAQNCARLYVNGMGSVQKERFRAMLGSGSECGGNIAQAYGVPLDEFIMEVRKIM